LVSEACEDWRDDFFEIASYFLYIRSDSGPNSRRVDYTGPRAIDAAARPIRPPFRACGWWTA
jgi:hypothetical protein